MDILEQKKQDGVKHYVANKEHKGNSNINSRSVFWHGKTINAEVFAEKPIDTPITDVEK